MSSEPKTDENGVIIITRAQLRNKALEKHPGFGRRARWYDRSRVTRVGNENPPKRTFKYVIYEHDLVVNNGSVSLEREGQVAVVVAVNHDSKTADVIGPEGPTTWEFREVNRTVEGQRSV